ASSSGARRSFSSTPPPAPGSCDERARRRPVRGVIDRVKIATDILIGLVALSHLGFLVLEMFFWDHPVGRRIFGMTPDVSAGSATLRAHPGRLKRISAPEP